MRLERFARFRQQAAPATPPANHVDVYPKTDGKLYAKNSAGIEYDLTATGGSSPTPIPPEMVVFTANGTFTKASYSGLVAVKVRVLGGGGAGGGAATTGSGQTSGGAGGSSGGYAEKYIPVASIPTTATVAVGAGGTPASGTTGGNGNASSFDGFTCAGSAGLGGGTAAAGAVLRTAPPTAAGTPGGLGDLVVHGTPGEGWLSLAAGQTRGGAGGNSPLGSGGVGIVIAGNGEAALSYGAGGGGATNGQSQATARSGGAGGPGIVIVELFYG
jgi:hypothetical protein